MANITLLRGLAGARQRQFFLSKSPRVCYGYRLSNERITLPTNVADPLLSLNFLRRIYVYRPPPGSNQQLSEERRAISGWPAASDLIVGLCAARCQLRRARRGFNRS